MYSHNKNEFYARSNSNPNGTNRSKSSNALPALQSTRILDQVRERIRYLHYARSTEQAYVYWIRFFIRWAGTRHPRDMGKDEVEGFLTFLAAKRGISSSTHRVALSALLFLYQKVLGVELPWLEGLSRPMQRRHLPVVLTVDEVTNILIRLTGHYAVLGRLLYGTGMRINEGLRLRVKDVDFDHRAIIIREGKGFKERVVMLPDAMVAPLKLQIANCSCSGAVGCGFGGGPPWHRDAGCACEKVSDGRQELGVVLGVSAG